MTSYRDKILLVFQYSYFAKSFSLSTEVSFSLALVCMATNAMVVKPKLMSFDYIESSQPSALINMIIKQSVKWRGLQWSLLLIKVVIKLSSAITWLQRPTGFVSHLPLRWHININWSCKSPYTFLLKWVY